MEFIYITFHVHSFIFQNHIFSLYVRRDAYHFHFKQLVDLIDLWYVLSDIKSAICSFFTVLLSLTGEENCVKRSATLKLISKLYDFPE